MIELQSFLDDIRGEVFHRAHAPGEGDFRLTALTEELLGRMEEAGILADWHVAFYRRERANLGAEVHGFSFDEDDNVLSLFYVIDAYEHVALGDPAPVAGTRKEEVNRAFRRMEACLRLARAGMPCDVDESHPSHELFSRVVGSLSARHSIELHVLTSGTLTERAAAVDEAEREFRRETWDLLRLQRTCGSTSAEGISVDFLREHQTTIPCLSTAMDSDSLQVMLACVPATIIAAIYNRYRSRLLERNVRSFLQFTGKVNQGMRTTILDQPERFLAYNNGLSATASWVELESVGDGLARIRAVHDFQIVNGGQTTATIASCARRDDANLSGISVAMKLTIVPPEQVDSLVGLISKYANTQNRIQEADFHANHHWHVELQRLSRSMWTSPTPNSPRGTRWYYERARGQYADELGANPTPAGKRKFRAENPSQQKFSKTELSKAILAWEGRPNVVSMGAQKCFLVFMRQFDQGMRESPRQDVFQRIVALLLLFQQAEQLHGEMGYQGYRANVVAYALAGLSRILGQRIPWKEIWTNQSVPSWMVQALKTFITAARDVITKPPLGNRNFSEWAKKEECWHALLEREVKVFIPTGLVDLLAGIAPAGDEGLASPRQADAPSSRVAGGPFDLAQRLKDAAVEVVDKRHVGGALWMIGGQELAPFMSQLRENNLRPVFVRRGSTASGMRPAWYLK